MDLRHSRLGLSLALIFSLAFASRARADAAASADDASRYSGPNWALLDTKAEVAAAAGIDLARFPNCNMATVDHKVMDVVREDGTGETQDESFVKVLTERARRNHLTLTRQFMLPYMTQPEVTLEVIKPDGTVVPVDVAKNGKVSIDSSMMQMNIYDPDFKVYRISIPKLEIGDIVHSVVRDSLVRAIIPGEFADDSILEGIGYIRHYSIEIRMPADKPLKEIVLRHEVPGTVVASTAKDGKELVYHWEVNKVPQIFPEPGMPPADEVAQRLGVSTTPDWTVISKWYWNLSKPHLDATSPELTKKVAELTAGATTDLQKITAIFYYVSKDIRYMGLTFEKDRPGFEPHDACITFDKKYGVCRDKAGLLVSMLRVANENAYPVLVSVGLKRDFQTPNPDFNHAIVAVELTKGQYTLMDPTAENTRQLLPAYDEDQTYLVCRPEGDVLRLSPVDPPSKNMMQIATTGTLDSQGTLEARTEMTFNGINDLMYRQGLAQMEEDDQRRFAELTLKRVMPGAVLKSLTITPDDLMDSSQPLRAVLVYTVPNTTVFGDGKAVVNVPWVGKSFGVVNFILRQTGLDKRKYPLKTFITCGLHEDISIRMANGFTGALSMPTCAPQDDDRLGYQRTYSFKDGILSATREFSLKTVEFSPGQYLQLKGVLKDLDQDDRKAPLMAAAEPSAASAKVDLVVARPIRSDVSVLSDTVEGQIADAHNATFTVHTVRKILTYAGKKRESEFKFEYNPSTEEAHVIRAVVTSRNGTTQTISPQEINEMDAGWNSSAKRYTGGKEMVASFPGVEIGSTIDLEYEYSMHGAPFIGRGFALELRDEVTQLERHITAPSDLSVQILDHGTPGKVTATHTTENGNQVWDWKASNIKPIPTEGALPPPWYWRSQANYFAGDFSSYLKDLNQALLVRSAHSTKAAELAQGFSAAAKSKLEAVQAIRDYVVQSIRTAGPAFYQLPLIELSDADTTLADGYGHDADKAILLHAMLTAAGFKPEFVLASDIPAIEPLQKIATQFPLPEEFGSVLVKLDVDGQTYYLNDTDQYARLGTTGHDGCLGIALSNGSYQTITAGPGDETKTENHFHVALSANGTVRLTVIHDLYGVIYNEQKKAFSEMRPEDRKRYFQNAVSRIAQGARAVGDLTANFSSYPGTERFTVDIDHYAVVDGKYLYFDLPYSLRLFPTGVDRRTLPLMIGHSHTDLTQADVELPAGFSRVVIAPRTEDVTAPSGTGSIHVSTNVSGSTWTVTNTLDSQAAVVAPGDYQALLQIESALENRSSHFLLLQSDKSDQAAIGP